MASAMYLFVVMAILCGHAITGIDMGSIEVAFKTNSAKVFTMEELERLLESDMEPVDVARSLARTKDKDSTVNGVSIRELIELNQYDTSVDCNQLKVRQRQELCKKTRNSLAKYCEACVDQIKTACLNKPLGILLSSSKLNSPYGDAKKFDTYLQGHWIGDEYPMQLYVVDFVHSLSEREQTEFKLNCHRLNSDIDPQLRFFGIKDRATFRAGFKTEMEALFKVARNCDYAVGPKFVASSKEEKSD